jgi:hypothetical protein
MRAHDSTRVPAAATPRYAGVAVPASLPGERRSRAGRGVGHEPHLLVETARPRPGTIPGELPPVLVRRHDVGQAAHDLDVLDSSEVDSQFGSDESITVRALVQGVSVDREQALVVVVAGRCSSRTPTKVWLRSQVTDAPRTRRSASPSARWPVAWSSAAGVIVTDEGVSGRRIPRGT